MSRTPDRAPRGPTLVELVFGLVLLSAGILALARIIPSASGTQEMSKLQTAATVYAQERVERLSALAWNDTALDVGRHPGGVTTEDLGAGGAWHRSYQVAAVAAPLDDLKKVTVTVTWTYRGERSTTLTTYLRR